MAAADTVSSSACSGASSRYVGDSDYEERNALVVIPKTPFSAHFEHIDWSALDAFACSHSPWSVAANDACIDPDGFEFEVKRNPYCVKLWVLYLDSKKTATTEERHTLYERALAVLPRSYKLWYRYLQERITAIIGDSPTSAGYKQVNNLFERCLIHLSLMPRIWLLYFDFLMLQPCITRTRRCFDRALQTLPVTQHRNIWDSYIQFVNRVDVPVTSVAVYRRYLMYEPSKVGAYVELLKRIGRIDQAAVVLADTLNSDVVSVEGKTSHQLWMDLCDLITQHPNSIYSLDIEAVLRSGLRKFTEQVARLWCSLASHYILLGQMDKARDVYECCYYDMLLVNNERAYRVKLFVGNELGIKTEALESISTANDFGIIFDAYANFLESFLSQLVESENSNSVEVDLYLERLEDLIRRRPLLLSSVKLRQNPHNVVEWFQRVKLFVPNDPAMAVKVFTEAVLTVDPFQAVGKYTYLWIQFAQFYESHGDVKNATDVFERAVKAKLRTVEDLAAIWCAWVEAELQRKNGQKALEIARRSVHKPPMGSETERGYHQHQAYRCVRLWSLCVDLEECFGTLATLEACYDKMFDLKVISPFQILNYASYLEERKYWERAFRVYERGVAILRWPHVYDVWMAYLAKFVSRYGGRKLERARELFEQALADAPPHLVKRIFLMYGKLEEMYGLARHALAIYDRATRHVASTADVYEFFLLLAAKTSEYCGITRTRPVFEQGIEQLSETTAGIPNAIQLGLRFVEIERSIGEIDRARATLQHLSQFCDPKAYPDFWQTWRQFEVAHGNEDLFRDMLRTKRSVQALYSEDAMKSVDVMIDLAQKTLEKRDAEGREATDSGPMQQLEAAVLSQYSENHPENHTVKNHT